VSASQSRPESWHFGSAVAALLDRCALVTRAGARRERLNRAARLIAIAHGGQIVASSSISANTGSGISGVGRHPSRVREVAAAQHTLNGATRPATPLIWSPNAFARSCATAASVPGPSPVPA